MKKYVLALGIGSCMVLSACGTPNVTSSFACPERFSCEPLDAAAGTVTFANPQTGVGGGTMGPLSGVSDVEEAKEKIMEHFKLEESSIETTGETSTGRPYMVFPDANSADNKSYAQILEKDGAFFACWATGRSSDANGTSVMGERVCGGLN